MALVSRVEKGESIILTRGGTPVAEIRPVAADVLRATPHAQQARIISPKLAHPEQAADFVKQIIEVSPDAA
jgi:antitoxin (DNA-binding transcriptional repressor) of toxin-antitoxin stability system